MMTNKTIYLLDAYALIYRAYYAFINNPRVTTSGVNTSATFGFCNFLLELMQEKQTEYIAVAFDPDGPNFRHELYPLYKAQRPKMPEDLRKSIPYIKDIIKGLGIRCLETPGFEADDIIATLALKAESEGFKVYMITPDKDYAQVVSDSIFMLKPPRAGGKSEVWGIPEVCDHFGIERVEQVVDILGLMGDTADNVPGCAGIGPKSAAELVSKYGTIQGIYDHIDELKGKQKEKLLECKDIVMLSRTLVTVHTEVPIKLNLLEDLKRTAIDEKILHPIFKELELFSLAKRLFNTDSEFSLQEKKSNTASDFKTEYKDMSDDIPAVLKTLNDAPEYALLTSFTSENVYNSMPSALYFTVENHKVNYIKLPSNVVEATKMVKQFEPLFADPAKLLISDDIKNNLVWFKVLGIDIQNKFFDVKIAHYVLHPDFSHELPRMALQYIDYQMSEVVSENLQLTLPFEEDVSNATNSNEKLSEQADICFQLKDKLTEALESVGLLILFNTIEMPLVPVLAAMEYEGVSVDKSELGRMSESLKTRIEVFEKEIYTLAGHAFNISSPKQLGDVLFDELHIDTGLTEKKSKTKSGQYSTSEQILSKLEGSHPIISKILDYRSLKKLLSTYTESLPTFVEVRTGKIHTRFNQIETSTGRLSSLNPNLQNIPIRTEEGRQIRKAFITGDPDYVFLSADYSQVELRLMAHISQDKELLEAFEQGLDVHTATAAKIYHVPLEQVSSEMRRHAKTANFGIIYGISAWGLAERLQISRKEGKDLIDGYFAMYPGVKKYMEEVVEKARKNEYVETIMGRRRYLRDINSRNAIIRGMAERNAINAPLQGSAADIIKMAMISINKELTDRHLSSKMILQVHDELNFKCHKDEQTILTELVRDCMEHIVKLSVPLTVSLGVGNNWYEAH
ncbi:DNA polymerase I [Bacteroidia bacterium]|nr:DNA polymerase I [Bacteroidia bacterium]